MLETNLIDFINSLKTELDNLKPLALEVEKRLWKKFRLEWNYNSNHIEGNTLTYGETELLLIFDKTTGEHEVRELEEMKAHDVAINLIKDWTADQERQISESDIRELNEILLVRPFWKDAITPDGQVTRRLIKIGEYKEFPNSVRLANGEIFEYTAPQEVSIQMSELIEWHRNQIEDLHPVIVAALLHYRFVRIHPFDDGNGRIARLLMNFELMRRGFPPVIIKTNDKKNYLAALNQADTGNMDAFVAYIAKELVWSLELSLKAANGENIEEPEDWKKKAKLLQQEITNGNNQPKVAKRTPELLIQRFDDSIIPFLSQLENDLRESFDELFVEHKRSYEIRFVTPVKRYEPRENSQKFSNLNDLKKVILNQESNIREHLTILFQAFIWQGFKGIPSNVFDYHLDIKILFDPFYYNISFNNLHIEKKLYTQTLSQEEIEAVTNTIGQKIFADIEDMSK